MKLKRHFWHHILLTSLTCYNPLHTIQPDQQAECTVQKKQPCEWNCWKVSLQQWHTGGGLKNSVEDTGQRGQGSRGGSPLVRGSAQMRETHIRIRLLWMYFQQNWEFSSALSKLQNFSKGGVWFPPSVCHWFAVPWYGFQILHALECIK
jgi:hypothetical protein